MWREIMNHKHRKILPAHEHSHMLPPPLWRVDFKGRNKALSLLGYVIDKQTSLMIEWERVGFIHGVMNTDNMTISGETIDYDPCAFMDIYDPETVFSFFW